MRALGGWGRASGACCGLGDCQHRYGRDMDEMHVPVTKAERLNSDKRRVNCMAGSSGVLWGGGNHPCLLISMLQWAAGLKEYLNTQLRDA